MPDFTNPYNNQNTTTRNNRARINAKNVRTFNNKNDSVGAVVQESREANKPFTFTFPADNAEDSFEVGGRSQHTMIITANKNVVGSTVAGRVDAITGSVGGVLGTLTGGAFPAITESVGGAVGTLVGGATAIVDGAAAAVDRGASRANQADKGNRFKEAVGLWSFQMPTVIAFTDANDYGEISLTSIASGFLTSASGIGKFGAAVDGIKTIASAGLKFAGLPINPKIEILFANKPQRRFQFEFLFAPTSKAEADSLKEAIQRLRAEASPILTATAGVLWQAPSTFDVRFLHNGQENDRIPTMAESVIEQIDLDYTPTGKWATFTNGFPVQTRITIRFRELDPIDREAVEAGF